ncbi:MAG: hypothetical protein U0531_19735 [Dehalococcoidia bacterium]
MASVNLAATFGRFTTETRQRYAVAAVAQAAHGSGLFTDAAGRAAVAGRRPVRRR